MSLPGSPTPRAADLIRDRGHHRTIRDGGGGLRDGRIRRRPGPRRTRLPGHPVPLPADQPADDEWGGDPRRRMRFLLEIVRRIRARVSPGFAVSVKLNSADFQRGGFSEDESRDVVAALAGEGLDLIEISGGNYESPAMSGSAAASTRDREAYFLDYARTVRQLAGDVPLAVTGGFRSRDGHSGRAARR